MKVGDTVELPALKLQRKVCKRFTLSAIRKSVSRSRLRIFWMLLCCLSAHSEMQQFTCRVYLSMLHPPWLWAVDICSTQTVMAAVFIWQP